MSMGKRFPALWICLWLVMLLACPARAAQTGSIRLRLLCEGEMVSGGTLTLYRVGAPGADAYTLSGEFGGSGADLSDLTDPDTARVLAEYAAARQIPGQTQAVDGTVCFAPLDVGLYLIVQNHPGPGYEPIRPFLVSIPMTVEGDVHYDVDASPKVAATPPVPWLPQTGQLNWPVPVLAAAGILLLGAGGTLYPGKRKDHET